MESYEKKSDQAASDADQLADEGDRVDKHIEDTKTNWEAKQGDASVPGAVPDPAEEEEAVEELEQEEEEQEEEDAQSESDESGGDAEQ